MPVDTGMVLVGNLNLKLLQQVVAKTAVEETRQVALVDRDSAAVVLDLGMPGMGGQRCLEELVRLDPDARVLVASGYGEPSLRSDLLAAGTKGFIGKPYRLRELCDKLRDMLDAPPDSAS